MKTVDCKTLNSWLDAKKAVLVDVREIFENKTINIKDSFLIPLGEIDEDRLPKLDEKNLVIYCKAGIRSAFACERLLAQNPDLKVYNLEGGINAWKNCGFEVFSDEN